MEEATAVAAAVIKAKSKLSISTKSGENSNYYYMALDRLHRMSTHTHAFSNVNTHLNLLTFNQK